MLRILLLVAAVVLLVWLIARARRGDRDAKPRASSAAKASRETMIACAHCGVHLPRGEAIESRGTLFCGDAHRLAFERTHEPR